MGKFTYKPTETTNNWTMLDGRLEAAEKDSEGARSTPQALKREHFQGPNDPTEVGPFPKTSANQTFSQPPSVVSHKFFEYVGGVGQDAKDLKHKVPPLRFAPVGMTDLFSELKGQHTRGRSVFEAQVQHVPGEHKPDHSNECQGDERVADATPQPNSWFPP